MSPAEKDLLRIIIVTGLERGKHSKATQDALADQMIAGIEKYFRITHKSPSRKLTRKG